MYESVSSLCCTIGKFSVLLIEVSIVIYLELVWPIAAFHVGIETEDEL